MDKRKRRELLLQYAGESSPWTPAALNPTLWGGQGVVTYAMQPTIPGAGWSGTNWAGSGLGPYTHTAGNTANLSNTVLTVGNRYLTAHAVSGRTAGSVTHYDGTAAGTARSADGTYTDELTCAGSGASIWTPSNDFNGAVAVQSIVNLSLSSYAPQIGAALAQATPILQPWIDPLTGLMRVKEDHLLSAAAASTFKAAHDGSGGTTIVTLKPVTLNADNYFLATAVVSSLNVGIAASFSNANTIRLIVMNGSGAYDGSSTEHSACSVAIGNTYVFTIRTKAGANGVNIRCNGVSKRTSALVAPSAANPTTGLAVGTYPGSIGNALDGYIRLPLFVPRYLSDDECLQAERYEYAAFTGSAAPW